MEPATLPPSPPGNVFPFAVKTLIMLRVICKTKKVKAEGETGRAREREKGSKASVRLKYIERTKLRFK